RLAALVRRAAAATRGARWAGRAGQDVAATVTGLAALNALVRAGQRGARRLAALVRHAAATAGLTRAARDGTAVQEIAAAVGDAAAVRFEPSARVRGADAATTALARDTTATARLRGRALPAIGGLTTAAVALLSAGAGRVIRTRLLRARGHL